jgi:hypothetical protein
MKIILVEIYFLLNVFYLFYLELQNYSFFREYFIANYLAIGNFWEDYQY